MSFSADELYRLLPTIYRLRDGEQGNPLRELMAVIAEQVAALEENLDQLYDDQFIETCADWVTPYIGDLIGYRALHGEVPSVASPRAEVANTIRFRRRKGTAAMLEQLARDVTGWPARTVEYFQLVGWSQYMNHLRPDAHHAPDLRRGQSLAWCGSAFDTLAHTVEVRRVVTGAGRHNIPNIGIHLWRVQAFALTRAPAVADALDAGGRLLRFNPLGADMQLFARPQTEEEITHLAEPFNVPLPLARRWLKAHLSEYYGADRSILIELAGANPGDPPQPVPPARIRVCDLSDVKDGGGTVIGWAHVPAPGSGRVAIDPVLGRIAFADAPGRAVLTSFHYGYTVAIGAGEYERGDTDAGGMSLRQVKDGGALQTELDAVQNGGVVEILDSGRYPGGLTIRVNAGKSVLLRAANGARPLIEGGNIVLDLQAGATIILDGIVVAGGAVTMAAFADKESRRLVLQHCTLVPGHALKADGTPAHPDDPSLVVAHSLADIVLSHCIVGALHLAEEATASIQDSIIDATRASGVAYRGTASPLAPGAALSIERCTVIGKLHGKQITLAEDALFVAELASTGETWPAPVWVERRQTGCVRFSFVPPGSHVPRRFRCQPDDARVRPHFASLAYGTAGYCQLRPATSDKIRRGAHDESEMGVLHDLFQPQRETNLRVRLEEYLRFGLEAGIFYAS